MNELSNVVANLKSVEDRVHSLARVEAKAASSVEEKPGHVQQQQAVKMLSSPVPLDLLDLLDFGAKKSEPGIGVHPECFARCLLAETSRQLTGLRRRKNALEKLGLAIDGGTKKESTENQNQSKEDAKNTLKRSFQDIEADLASEPPKSKIKTEG